MNRIDDWMEVHLPWTVNNFLRWLTCLLLIPISLLLILVGLLALPFTRGFHDGSTQLLWGWEELAEFIEHSFGF